MRKLLIFVAMVTAVPVAAACAQQGPHIDGYTDLRNTDMGAHDSVTQPSDRDLLMRAINNDNVERAAKAKRDKLGYAHPAKRSDLVAGAGVFDKEGVAIAKIDLVDADGVVLATGSAKIKVPADAFGINKQGLLLEMTKAQFEQIVTKANAGS